jgi:hypothetical protein
LLPCPSRLFSPKPPLELWKRGRPGGGLSC